MPVHASSKSADAASPTTSVVGNKSLKTAAAVWSVSLAATTRRPWCCTAAEKVPMPAHISTAPPSMAAAPLLSVGGVGAALRCSWACAMCRARRRRCNVGRCLVAGWRRSWPRMESVVSNDDSRKSLATLGEAAGVCDAPGMSACVSGGDALVDVDVAAAVGCGWLVTASGCAAGASSSVAVSVCADAWAAPMYAGGRVVGEGACAGGGRREVSRSLPRGVL